MPSSENRQPYPPPLSAKMLGPTNRAIGTMLHAAPAFANHGVCFNCSAFARVIVALLVEAQAPQLEHLWVSADDEPCAARHYGKTENSQHSDTNEEDRYRHENDRHPC